MAYSTIKTAVQLFLSTFADLLLHDFELSKIWLGQVNCGADFLFFLCFTWWRSICWWSCLLDPVQDPSILEMINLHPFVVDFWEPFDSAQTGTWFEFGIRLIMYRFNVLMLTFGM